MAAVMRILGWKAEGLRCPDHEIRCSNEDGELNPVTLVQMPNGTGKTTTLELLRVALSGSAAEEKWDRAKIREYQKKNNERSDGLFEVRLLLNDRRVTIRMEFDFENERIYYKTTHTAGQRNGFHPPSDFRRFMNENFVNFYVFDGELAQDLLDHEKSDAEIVVEYLFQISLLQNLKKKVAKYWNDKTQHVDATEKQGLSRRRNRLDQLKRHRQQLIEKRDALCDERSKVEEGLKNKEGVYKHEIGKVEVLSEKLKSAETEADQLKAKVREEALETLDMMRTPYAISPTFAKAIMDLKTGLDRVKLPERAAREFFEELADEPDCVCGRPIDDKIKEIIKSRAEQYLGSEDVAFLNSMKSAIQAAVGTSIDKPAQELNDKITILAESVSEDRTASNDVDALRLEAEQSDPAVAQAREEINALKEERSGIDEELKKFESRDQEKGDERTFGIEVINERIERAEKKLAEITETMELKSKRDILLRILENVHEKARDEITKEICAEANRRIRELMPHNNIPIDRIEKCLILQGQESGSEGETLSVAWGFLATLFHRSEHKLPFVVDSPAGSIDLAVRPKIGQLIPSLTGQFIAFMISSEREQFVEPLKRESSKEVQFVTLFRRGPSEIESRAKALGLCKETVDGLNVSGEAFFNEFQLNDEEGA